MKDKRQKMALAWPLAFGDPYSYLMVMAAARHPQPYPPPPRAIIQSLPLPITNANTLNAHLAAVQRHRFDQVPSAHALQAPPTAPMMMSDPNTMLGRPPMPSFLHTHQFLQQMIVNGASKEEASMNNSYTWRIEEGRSSNELPSDNSLEERKRSSKNGVIDRKCENEVSCDADNEANSDPKKTFFRPFEICCND